MDDLFNISYCKEFGEFTISKKDFAEGQRMLDEQPVLSTPLGSSSEEDFEFCCVSCFKILPYHHDINCTECGFPICNDTCGRDEFHRLLECKLFSQRTILPSNEAYHGIKFVRFLLSEEIFPERYGRIQKLSSDLGQYQMTPTGEQECEVAFDFITENCKLQFTRAQIKKAWATFKINAFLIPFDENTGKRYRGYCLYSDLCKIGNSCAPSCEWFFVKTISEDGTCCWRMHLQSVKRIKKGDMLTITYVPDGLDYGTGMRQIKFHDCFTFKCLCTRCVDATEQGTFFSSPKCMSCEDGYWVPEDPLHSFTCRWKCTRCSHLARGKDIKKTLEKGDAIIKQLMSGPATDAVMGAVDGFIESNSDTNLHPNHYLLFQVSLHWLINADFSEVLMEDSEASEKLYDKIMERYYRCISLVKKFCMDTMTIVELEIVAMDAIASFAFKTEAIKQVFFDPVHLDPRSKFKFAKKFMYHLSQATFWTGTQPNYAVFQIRMENLGGMHTIWMGRCEWYKNNLLKHRENMEEFALLQLKKLFI